MRKNKRKIIIIMIMSVVLMGIMSCGNGNSKSENSVNSENTQKNEKQTENTQQQTEEKKDDDVIEGIDEEFVTDGKLHEEEILNKHFSYPDSGGDSFKIEKDKDGYFITEYIEKEDDTSTEEKTRLKLYKDVYLVHENGILAYGYDTVRKKVAILSVKNDYRIIYETEILE